MKISSLVPVILVKLLKLVASVKVIVPVLVIVTLLKVADEVVTVWFDVPSKVTVELLFKKLPPDAIVKLPAIVSVLLLVISNVPETNIVPLTSTTPMAMPTHY